MAQKLWRVVRACVELGPDNPIQQIHDQGAGGNCNVVSGFLLPCHMSSRSYRLVLGTQSLYDSSGQKMPCILQAITCKESQLQPAEVRALIQQVGLAIGKCEAISA